MTQPLAVTQRTALLMGLLWLLTVVLMYGLVIGGSLAGPS